MKRSRKHTEEPFQMAPMIDMVFLLLVFFMTVSTLAKDARPDILLPESVTAEVPDEIPPRDIVTVMPKGEGYQFHWHNRAVTETELSGLLMDAAKQSAGPQLLLRGPPELPWSAWQVVIEHCREAGISDLIFATHES
ncbi:MAG: ExbD/TolR family protein [Puniceicoccaceae bacterium]